MDLNLYIFNSASLLPLNYLLGYLVPIRKGDTHSDTHCGSLFLLICYHLQDRSLTKAHCVSTSFLLFNAKSIKDQKKCYVVIILILHNSSLPKPLGWKYTAFFFNMGHILEGYLNCHSVFLNYFNP